VLRGPTRKLAKLDIPLGFYFINFVAAKQASNLYENLYLAYAGKM
jgi:hypothetical protein